MTDTTSTQVVVTANPLPSILTTLLRYVAAPIGGFLLGKGWIMADQLPEVAGVLMFVASGVWGIYSTWKTHGKLVTVAADPRTPEAVATVK